MMMSFMGFFHMVMIMGIFRTKQFNAAGCINGSRVCQQILHKFLQTGTGDHDQFGSFRSLDLTHIQGVVMQTGDFLRNQPGYGKRSALA